MSWKRFILLIASVAGLAGATKLVMACAGGDESPDVSVFFLNTINKQPALVPFYYTPSLVFYTDGYDIDTTDLDYSQPDQNAAAWKSYTGGQVNEADIDSFVYRFSAVHVAAVYEHIDKKTTLNVPAEVGGNGFTKWLIAKKDKDAAQYLAFAKECEPYTVPLEAMWDDKTSEYVLPKRDSAAMQLLATKAAQRYDELKNSDLKIRYAYQAMRMAFYSRQYQQTVTLFDNMAAKQPEGYMYYRCLALKAGGLYKTGKKTEAAYLYSLVFDKSEEDKKNIYTSFRWAVNGDIYGAMKLCKNDHEKAVLYVMKAMYDYNYSDKHRTFEIEAGYNLDVKVKGLDVAMTRAINKTEFDLGAGIAADSNSRNIGLQELNSFAQRVAREGKRGDPAYWYLCSAYCSVLLGDAEGCKKMLVKAQKETMTAVEEDVHDIINVLYVMRKDTRITPQTEAELLPLLQATKQKAARKPKHREVFINMMTEVLKEGYLHQGDTIKALYCYSRAGNSYGMDYTDAPGMILEAMTPDELHKVQAFAAKKNKTPFEQWLTDSTIYTAAALYELEGTKSIRMYQFDKAISVLQKVPADILVHTVLPDVMISHIQDMQDLNKSDTAVTYNKLSFSKKMLELQQILEKNPKDGRAAYQYANGLYNMSYYGKAHHAYDYYRSSWDENAYFDSRERRKMQGYEQEHYNVKLAEQYYRTAFENSTDKEVKARCLFMAAKCWQKSCPSKNDHADIFGDEKTYYQNTFKNPFFKQLKADYRNTKFFSSAMTSCSYLRDYVKQVK